MADEEKEITLNFIESYRSFSQLWDPNHKFYSNKVKRNDGLQVLATKYNMDIEGVKKKIKSLRSYFSKEHQKVIKKNSGAGSDEIYHSPWFAYKHLLFITDSVTPRETGETSTEEEKADSISQDENTESLSSLLENHHHHHISHTATGFRPPPIVISENTEHEFIQPIRKKRNVCESRMDEREDEAYNIMKIVCEKMINNDECNTFGRLIACKLRKLSPRNRLLAERRINDIFFNLELEEIDSTHNVYEYSVVPPTELSPATSTQSVSTEDLLLRTENMRMHQMKVEYKDDDES